MNSQSLKQQLPKLQSQKFAGMSDADVLSYVRIYYSLYHLVSTNSLAEEYGAPALYRRKITLLYRMLIRRYHSRAAIAERARILNALYTLVYCTEYTVDDRLYDEYLEAGEILLAGYEADDVRGDEATYYMMRLVLIQSHGMVDDTHIPVSLEKLRTILGTWSSALGADGRWQGVTEQEALRRIDILSLNADLMCDYTHTASIAKAYAAYCHPHKTQNYTLLYDLIRFVTITDTDTHARLSALSEMLPNDSLQAYAIAIEDACRKAGEEVQNSLVF